MEYSLFHSRAQGRGCDASVCGHGGYTDGRDDRV